MTASGNICYALVCATGLSGQPEFTMCSLQYHTCSLLVFEAEHAVASVKSKLDVKCIQSHAFSPAAKI